MAVKFAETTEITEAEAVSILRERLDKHPVHRPRFKRGDAVRLDNGCIGVVTEEDSESVAVIFLDEDGLIQGPSMGWELVPLEEFNK